MHGKDLGFYSKMGSHRERDKLSLEKAQIVCCVKQNYSSKTIWELE